MRNLEELNINSGGHRVIKAPPTSAQIAAFEKEFGVKIPSELLDLLQHSNGGHPELDTYFPSHEFDNYLWAVSRFYFLDGDRQATGGMWQAASAWRSVLGESALPFADTGGGDTFFLDCSTAPARVGVTVHDENFRIVWLAPSLDEFLDGLALDPDAI
jgi:hypothetical protein